MDGHLRLPQVVAAMLLGAFLSGCASSLGTSGYELDVEKCYQSGGMVLTDHNTEVSRCIY
jgi:hypothetical protein